MSSNSINISALFADKFGFEKTSNTAQQSRLSASTENNSGNFLSIEDTPQETRPEEIKPCGAELFPGLADIIGGIINDLDGESKDGEIGDTNQVGTGNCWLLSGINALNTTQEGKKLIRESLDYKSDHTVVHTACGDYVVTDDEITRTKGSLQYSGGDDDMIIFELALEKMIDDCINGTIELSDDAPPVLNWLMSEEETRPGHSSTTGGWSRAAMYLITGKMGESYRTAKEMEEQLEKFKNNNKKDFAVAIDTDKSSIVLNANGIPTPIVGNHAYSVKDYDGVNVTVINPWDSGHEIVLPKEEFFKAFQGMDVCDLSKNNEKVNHFKQKVYYSSNGMVDRTEERVEDEKFTRTYKYCYDDENELSKVKFEFVYDSGFCGGFNFDENKNYTSGFLGNKDTKTTLTFNMDNDDNRSGYQLGEVDKDGNLKYNFVEMTDEIGKRIDDNYQILQYDNLSASDVFVLARDLSDAEFDKAIDYLKQHPNATYQEVMNNID